VRLRSRKTHEQWIAAVMDDGFVVLFEDDEPRLGGLEDTESVEVRVDGQLLGRYTSGSGELAEPLRGINQMAESDLKDLTVWIPRRGEQAEGLEIGVNLNTAWSIDDVQTGYFQVKRAGAGTELVCFDPLESQFLPIRPKQPFAATGLYATRHCRAELAIQFFDHRVQLLDETTPPLATTPWQWGVG
jgi:hypothetical protein